MLGVRVVEDELRRRGLSIRAGAREIGIAHTTLIRFLQGMNVDMSTLNRISRWLGREPGMFLGNTTTAHHPLEERVSLWLSIYPELATLVMSLLDAYEDGRLSNEDLAELGHYAQYIVDRA